jgi:molecular chaperone DnaJ
VLRQNGFFSLRQTCRGAKAAAKRFRIPAADATAADSLRSPSRSKSTFRPGLDDGVQLKLRNQGEPSTDGGPRGDFYCAISVEEHKIFTRKGRDLLVDCRISPAEAALDAKSASRRSTAAKNSWCRRALSPATS